MEKKNVTLIALVVILAIVIIANVVIALVFNGADNGDVTDAERLERHLSRQGFTNMPLTSLSETEAYLRKNGFSKKLSEDNVTEYYRTTASNSQASVIVIQNFDSEEEALAYYEEHVEQSTGSLFNKDGSFVYEEQSAGVKTSGSFLLRGDTVYSTRYYVRDSSISTIRNLRATSYGRAEVVEYLLKHGYVLTDSADDYDVYYKDYGDYLPDTSEVTVYKNKGEDYYNELKYARASYRLSKYPDFSIVGDITRDRLFIDLSGCGCALIGSATERVVVEEEVGFNKTSSEILEWLRREDIPTGSLDRIKEYIEDEEILLQDSYTDFDGSTVKVYSSNFRGKYSLMPGDHAYEFLSEYGGEHVDSTTTVKIAEYDSAASAATAFGAIEEETDEVRYAITVNGKTAVYREYIDSNDDYVNGEMIFTVDNAIVSLSDKIPSTERLNLMYTISGIPDLKYYRDEFLSSLGGDFSTSDHNVSYIQDGNSRPVNMKIAESDVGATLKLIAIYFQNESVADDLYGRLISEYKKHVESASVYESSTAIERNTYYYIKGSDGNGVEPELFAMHVNDGSSHTILLIGYVTDLNTIVPEDMWQAE